MQYIDVHAHYDDEQYSLDLDDELKAIKQTEVVRIINAGSSIENSKKAIALANKYDYIYATVGIHPEMVEQLDRVSEIEQLAKSEKVVAVGEIGLDYHYEKENKERQIELFTRQLSIAKQFNLPVQIHERDAVRDMLQLLSQENLWPNKVMFHCFDLNCELTKVILDRKYYVSLGGNITYKRSESAIEQIRLIPLTQIMLETDAPYLAPEGFRGSRNSSKYLYKVAEKIAQIKGITVDEVVKQTNINAKNVYNLK